MKAASFVSLQIEAGHFVVYFSFDSFSLNRKFDKKQKMSLNFDKIERNKKINEFVSRERILTTCKNGLF